MPHTKRKANAAEGTRRQGDARSAALPRAKRARSETTTSSTTTTTQRQGDRGSGDDKADTAPLIVPLPDGVDARLLYPREQSAHLLQVSMSTIRRMEANGRLRVVRPTGSATGKVHHPGADLLKIVHGEAASG